MKDKLLSEGWTLVPDSIAPEVHKVVKACSELPVDFISSGKPFLRKLFKEGCDNIPPEVDQLASNPAIIDVVETYFGEPAQVLSLRLFYSQHHRNEPKKSQLYHCDGGPEKMVKLFVYCTDVGLENGPFSFLPLNQSKKLWTATNYDTTKRLRDDEVTYAIGKVAPIQIIGPKGTAFLVDSGKCFHYGARVDSGAAHRLVLVVQYAPYNN